MKKALSLMLVAGLMTGLVSSAHAAKKPVVMFEDATGDADNAQGAGQSIPGGFDLVGGTLALKGKNLEFVVSQADMPPTGSGPEGFRLLYHFGAGDEQYRFTVKSVDIGKPDVVAGGTGQERVGQVYQGVARLEQCGEEATAALTLVQCSTSVYVEAVFDPAAATITWQLPLSEIGAKKGTLITGGTDGAAATSCQVCWVPHYAERSLTPTTVIDFAAITGTFKV
ncbi:MAG: hypothetical protein QOG04_487 [Actinomycetota bacterium]|jgi:hypothetical protein|nr:hypothetical protein [Actinomycetota bacterium]